MARIAYSTSSTPPTRRNAPPPEYENETWQDWLTRQGRPIKSTASRRPNGNGTAGNGAVEIQVADAGITAEFTAPRERDRA